LERLNPEMPSNNPSNWHSAASDVGYATPTYKNSQYSDINNSGSEITIDPSEFSPDGDGYHDNLIISYKFDKAGYFGSITIYDLSGREIKKLVNNDLLGTEGFYTWDGLDNNGSRAPIGVYIIYIEVANKDGTTKRFKKSCTLALKR